MNKNLSALCKSVFALVFLFPVTLKVTAQPIITSFSPASGTVGTNVTITGTNFNATATNNIVYFGAVKATVNAATSANLNVEVHAGSTFQPISVLNTATGLTAYSSKPFLITFANPAGVGIPANFYKPRVDFVTGTSPRSVAVQDVDGDGKPDLLVANSNANTISVLRNTSTSGNINASSFATAVDFTTGTFTQYVTAGDIDGDGKPDLIVVDNNNISILHNTSTPGSINASSFAAKVAFDLLFTGPVAVAIGDVDGDGKPDLVAANATSNSVSILRNTSAKGVINTSSFAAKVNFATGGTPFFVAFGDIDGDGKPELVTANAGASANSISVLRNTSIPGAITTASFAAKVDFSTGIAPRCVALGDLDGDGKTDIAVANADPVSNAISVLRNTATSGSITTASFAAKTDFITGTSPYSITIGDADGDGKPDLVAACQNSNTISVLRNTSSQGNISTAAKVDFGTSNLPRSVAMGDLDGDGIPEIITANFSSNSVSVFQINLSALPVNLTDIKAYPKNMGVQIEWTAQHESNIESYEVERSQDGRNFKKIDSVRAAGNGSIAIKYNLFDGNPFSGLNFYRIKIKEAGKETYSRILKVNRGDGSKNYLTVYPNPVEGNTISLEINLPVGNYTILLTNLSGQQVMNKKIKHPGGATKETIQISKSQVAGIYRLTLTGEGVSIMRQIVKH